MLEPIIITVVASVLILVIIGAVFRPASPVKPLNELGRIGAFFVTKDTWGGTFAIYRDSERGPVWLTETEDGYADAMDLAKEYWLAEQCLQELNHRGPDRCP